jgi:hypothetical protein
MSVAVMPMVVIAASETRTVGSYSPLWLISTTGSHVLSPGEYKPAETRLMEFARVHFAGSRVVSPEEVDQAMRGSAQLTVEEAVPAVALAVQVDAVLLMRLRVVRFQTGLPGAPQRGTASGHADLTLHSGSGKVIWSLAGKITRLSTMVYAGDTPTLLQLVDYTLDEFADELRSRRQPS